MQPTIRAILVTLLTLLICVSAQALSLGEASVRSFLGQPLSVEIALPGTTEAEATALRARIGAPQDFERLALEYHHDIATLQVEPRLRGTEWFIQITSEQAFKQPILQFPLRVTSGDNHLIRAYTLLLDPPNYRFKRQSTSTTTKPSSSPAYTQAIPAGISYSPYTYRIGDGETLWPIAAEFKPLDTSTPRMMRAIVEANPDAFVDSDMNRVRSGSLLRIPNVSWGQVRAYERPEGGTPTITSKRDEVPEATTEPEEERASAASTAVEAPPVIEVLGKSDENASPAEDLKQKVYLTYEEVERNRLEQQQIREQIKELKQELQQLQQLMKLKDQQIATLQAVVDAQKQAEQKPQVSAVPVEQAAPAEAAIESSPQVIAPAAVAATAVQAAQIPQKDSFPWWIVMLTVITGLFGAWWWLRSTQDRKEDVTLAHMPEIFNAPPAPYTEEVSAHHYPGEAEPDDPSAAQGAPVPPAQASNRIASTEAERSQVDVLLEEIDSAFPELEELSVPTSGTQSTVLEVPEDDHITEDELAELAEQLTRDLEMESEHGASEEPQSTVDEDLEQLFGVPLEPAEEEIPVIGLDSTGEADEIDESLDMARAYLSVGDNDAAAEILQQALKQTDEPQKRSRIEELLAQAS